MDPKACVLCRRAPPSEGLAICEPCKAKREDHARRQAGRIADLDKAGR